MSPEPKSYRPIMSRESKRFLESLDEASTTIINNSVNPEEDEDTQHLDHMDRAKNIHDMVKTLSGIIWEDYIIGGIGEMLSTHLVTNSPHEARITGELCHRSQLRRYTSSLRAFFTQSRESYASKFILSTFGLDEIRTSIETVKDLGIPLTGIATGVRVYPGTPLARSIASGFGREGLYPEGTLAMHEPVFFLSPYLGGNVIALIDQFVADDERFLFLGSPGGKQNYNYANDDVLCNLICEGARGAYWDIIRRSR